MNAVASAQLTLVDGRFAWEGDGFAKHNPGPGGLLPHWRRPHDYRGGDAHIRIEVTVKPDASTATNVLCRLCSGPHQDRSQNLRLGVGVALFHAAGIHRFEMPVASASPLIEPSNFRWDSPVTEIQVTVADARGQMVSKWERDLGTLAGAMSDYLPLHARYTVILAPVGHPFQPPDFW